MCTDLVLPIGISIAWPYNYIKRNLNGDFLCLLITFIGIFGDLTKTIVFNFNIACHSIWHACKVLICTWIFVDIYYKRKRGSWNVCSCDLCNDPWTWSHNHIDDRNRWLSSHGRIWYGALSWTWLHIHVHIQGTCTQLLVYSFRLDGLQREEVVSHSYVFSSIDLQHFNNPK